MAVCWPSARTCRGRASVIYSKVRGRGVGLWLVVAGLQTGTRSAQPPRKKPRREKHGSKDPPLQWEFSTEGTRMGLRRNV